eukprot:gene5527-9344_t
MENLDDTFNIFMQKAKSMKKVIDSEKKDWEKQKELIKRVNFNDSDILELNVGGMYYSTFKSTLSQKINQEENYFTSNFSGRFEIPTDKQGRYFIDRDGSLFKYVLSFLRESGSMKNVTFPTDKKLLIELKNEFEFYTLPWPFQSPSSLISLGELATIDEWCEFNGKWKLIYKASVDGFESSTFHSKCNHQGKTLCVIKSENGNVFGGFNAIPWASTGNYRYHKDNFIFSLKTSDERELMKYKQDAPHAVSHSIYDHSSYHCTFGGGHDIHICNNSNTLDGSYSNLGYSYTVIGEYYGSEGIKNIMGGTYKFKTLEIEVLAQI